jgi:hypothetical protein
LTQDESLSPVPRPSAARDQGGKVKVPEQILIAVRRGVHVPLALLREMKAPVGKYGPAAVKVAELFA